MKKQLVIFFIIIGLQSFGLRGQDFFSGDLGFGGQGVLGFWSLEAATGMYIKPIENLSLTGGLRFNRFCLNGACHSNDAPDDDPVRKSIMTVNLHLSAAYYLKVFDFKAHRNFKSFGIFPEIKFLFNPMLPRRMVYENNGVFIGVKGGYKAQASFGYGGGIFFTPKRRIRSLISLHFEINHSDPFEVLRGLNYQNKSMPFDKKSNQFIISFRLSNF